MAGRKKGSKYGPYEKTCYFLGTGRVPTDTSLVEVSRRVYPFAAEVKSKEEFLAEYENNSDLYIFLDECDNPTGNRLLATKIARGKQENNQKTFCRRCEERDSVEYQQCEVRQFVSQENELSITIQDRAKEGRYYCPACQKIFYEYACKKVQRESNLQDIRLLSRPAVLAVSRGRAKCPACGTLAGERQITGFQAYCDGTMTCRLAENVLFAQLSMIKREYVSEAYGISKDHIDRIKKRMIDQSKDIKRRLVKLEISKHVHLPVIMREFKDSRSKHVYICYFLQGPNNKASLVQIMTQADREALPKLDSDRKEFCKHFPEGESFYLACYCCLAGERGLRDQELSESLAKYEQLYESRFPQQADDEYWSYDTERKRSYERMQKESAGEQLRSLWRTGVSPDTYQLEDNGQYILAGFSEPQITGIKDYGSNNEEVNEFVALLKAVLKKYKTTATTVKETLLNFNPAVITELEMAMQTGKRLNGLDDRVVQTEGIYMAQPPFGVPLACLTCFLNNGLFAPDNKELLPCMLMKQIRYDDSGERILPCGNKGDFCPHLKTT